MTLTKEWLRKTIAELEEERDAVPGVVNEDAVMALEAMKLALASLELERGMIRRFDLDMSDCDSCGQDCGADMVEDLDGEYVLWDEVLPHLYRYDEYTIPPAPVSVPDEATPENIEILASTFAPRGVTYQWDRDECNAAADSWNACCCAMLQGADRPQNEPQNIPENIPATQFKPVADLYGLTSPTGGETSFTFDAVEARDFIDGGWSCQEYVELGRFQEAMLQNGNSPAQSDCCPEQNYIAPAQDGDSPVIPDGWVLVPVEPTAEMLQSGISAHYERSQIQIHDKPAPGPMECAYVAMLAAAPTHSCTNDGWVACSERMPDQYNYDIWVYSPNEGVCHGVAYAGDGEFADDEFQYVIRDASHWMPMVMPAAPQQE